MAKLKKSSNQKVLFGVCGGLGEKFNIDPSIIRVVFVVGTLFSVDFLPILYIVLAICMPSK